MADKFMTNEEIIERLKQEVEKSKIDSFRIKIYRKRQVGAFGEHILTLGEANISHLVNPEMWLPKICGGGPIFQITAFHASDFTVPAAQALAVQINGQPFDPPRVASLRQPGWNGPTELLYPDPNQQPLQTNTFINASPPPGGASTVPQSPVSGGISPVGGSVYDPRIEAMLASIRAKETEIENTKRMLDEERRRFEIENARRESDARFAQLEAKMTRASEVKPGGGFAEIVGALAPIVQGMLAGQNEMRVMMMRAEQENAKTTQLLLGKMMERPPIDPTVLALLNQKQQDNTPEMMTHMTNALSVMTRTQMDVLEMAAETIGGGQQSEHPILMAIKEGVKAINTMAIGVQTSALKKKRAVQALSPGQPHPTLPANGQSAVAPQQTLQVPVTQFPHKQPYKAPAVQSIPMKGPLHNQAMGDYAAKATSPIAPIQPPSQTHAARASEEIVAWANAGERPEPPGVIDQIMAMIEEHSDPRLVAQSIIYSLSQAEVQTALEEVGNEFPELAARRLGSWPMQDPVNPGYLAQVLEEFNRLGAASGIFEEEDETDDGSGDEPDEDSGHIPDESDLEETQAED